MARTLCPFCGWGSQIKDHCADSSTAEKCELNLENVRKFGLRFKQESRPNIVRSVRYQGDNGKGDSYEWLERVE